MDFLWTPWRYRYLAEAHTGKQERCIFCDALAAKDDAATGIVLRGKNTFVILNRFPYTSGHVMIVPYAHGGGLASAEPETLGEMMQIAQKVQAALERIYHPHGYNLGINLGRAAGAGITDHLHLHLLPRWMGDANFMTTVAETRMEPETLESTYAKLHGELAR